MKKKILYSLLAIVFVVTTQSVSFADILIDNYTAGNQLIQGGPDTATQTTMSGSIFGGQRIDSVTVPAGDTIGSYTFNNTWAVAQGNSDEIFGSLTYNNFTDFDFTQSGTLSQFAIEIVANDVDMVLTDVLSIEVESAGVTQLVNFDLPASSNIPSTTSVSFSEFTNIDFTQVDSVVLGFDTTGNPGRDFEVALFSAVPEPTGGLVGIGLLCGLFLRRKRSV